MSPWDFFETIAYINLPERKDRWMQLQEAMVWAGVIHPTRKNVLCIPGIIADTPMKGFNQAQRNALESVKQFPVVIFEDDVTFHDIGHLEAALSELPSDWDILYLGANIIGTDLCNWPVPEYFSSHLRRIKQAWTTHAVCYSAKGRDWILKNWDHTDGQMYDDFLRVNLEKLQAFIIYPMIADQRPGFSDIWNRDTHYGFFEQGNKKMGV